MSGGRTPYRQVAPVGTTAFRRPGLSVPFLNARTRAKRVLVGAYCHGLIPGWAVSVAFRLLNLEKL